MKFGFSEFLENNIDYVPYACYYDRNTMLTRNGELMQIIKIDEENADCNMNDLRALICKTLEKYKKSWNETALWITYLKRKIELTNDQPQRIYAKMLSDSWNAIHNWNNRAYSYDMYVTIIRSGMSMKINLGNFNMNTVKKKHLDHIKKTHSLLEKEIDEFMANIRPYDSHRLSIVNRGGIFYSEHIEFFRNILYGDSSPVRLDVRDLGSLTLENKSQLFSYDYLTISDTNNDNKKYVACFVAKSFGSPSEEGSYGILGMETELNVTESIVFTKTSKIQKIIGQQSDSLSISNSSNLKSALKLEHIVQEASAYNNPKCKLCDSITIFAQNRNELDEKAKILSRAMDNAGIVGIRVNLRLDMSFWSQLPGNFSFIPYYTLKLTENALPVFDAHKHYIGSMYGGHWVEYISILGNQYGKPYYFNFHVKNVGHVLTFGDEKRRIMLINFLISQSLRLNKSIIILDWKQRSRLFINALQGKYLAPKAKKNPNDKVGINLFKVSKKESFRKIVTKILLILTGATKTTEIIENIDQVVKEVCHGEEKNKNLSFVAKKLSKYWKDWDDWVGSGKYAGFFDYEENASVLVEYGTTAGIDFTEVAKEPRALSALLEYVNFIAEERMRKESIIFNIKHLDAVRECDLFENNRFKKWLNHLTEKDSIAILECTTKKLTKCHIARILGTDIKTMIALPEEDGCKPPEFIDLKESEKSWLRTLKPLSGWFLLKQGDNAAVKLYFDIRNIGTMRLLYGSSLVTKEALSIRQDTEDHKQWLMEMTK